MLTLDLEQRQKTLEDKKEICEGKETQYQNFEFDHEGVRLEKKTGKNTLHLNEE